MCKELSYNSIKKIMLEDLSVNTIVNRGIKVDRNIFPDRAYLLTNIETGEQSISLDDLLNSGDFFVGIIRDGKNINEYISYKFIDSNMLYLNIFKAKVDPSSSSKIKDISFNKDEWYINVDNKEGADKRLPKNLIGCKFLNIQEYIEGKDLKDYSFFMDVDNDNRGNHIQKALFATQLSQSRKAGNVFVVGNELQDLVLSPMDYLSYKEPEGSKNKVREITQLVDQIDDTPTKDIESLFEKHKSIFGPHDRSKSLSILEKKNLLLNGKEYSGNILRCYDQVNEFTYNYNGACVVNKKNHVEYFRFIYLSDEKGVEKRFPMRKNNNGKWINTSVPYSWSSWNHLILPFDKKDLVGSLQYVKNIFSTDDTISIKRFVNLLDNQPVIEKLWKFDSGLVEKLFTNVTYDKAYNIYSELAKVYMFNDKDSAIQKKNIYGILGFNKNQINIINDYASDLKDHFKDDIYIDKYIQYKIYSEIKMLINYVVHGAHIKRSLRNDSEIEWIYDVRDIDEKTFKSVLNVYFNTIKSITPIVKDSKDQATYTSNILYNRVIQMFRFVDMKDISLLEKANNFNLFIQNINNAEESNNNYYSSEYAITLLLNDYNNMLVKINDYFKKQQNGNFVPIKKNRETLINRGVLQDKHNELIEIYNKIENDYQEALFDEASKSMLKYEYTGDKFSMIAPKKITDIAYEGLALRHCVKSYTSDVLNKDTNILFIRQNDDIDTPFYTLEYNDNKIIQVYGFSNTPVQDKDLQEFIDEWEKQLKEKRQQKRAI